MPATFHIGLPNIHQRKCILKQVLRIESVSEDVDYNRLSDLTEGFSGSDLRELCRTAAVYRVREMVGNSPDSLREINFDDLLKALRKMKESKIHCGAAVYQSYSVD